MYWSDHLWRVGQAVSAHPLDDLMVVVREGGGAPQRSFGLPQDPCEDKPRENFSNREIHDFQR